ncbi:probable thiopurine S-methyltransferase [Haliotis cracherodii]|uniref:probable thiopurine S-methyltransferase n=1 Tax=Haliotis cracherodii TaxID=6455 RepID=UPI0039E7FE54
MAEGEPQPFHVVPDDPDERLKQVVDFWNEGEMDYPAELNPTLEKHFDQLTGSRGNLKVLVTLCGKAEDLRWLSDKGHYVVGVDIAEKAAADFFSEQKLEYTTEDVPAIKGKVFTSKTGQLKYYCGNFFTFSQELEGQFDVIWDAAGFVSLDKRDWDKYLAVWRTLLSPTCVFFFETMDYDRRKFKGPPYSMEPDEIKGVFGSELPNLQLVETRPNVECEGFTFNFYSLRRH